MDRKINVRKVVSYTLRTVLSLAFVLLFLFLFLHIPSVQNGIVNAVIRNVVPNDETSVKIGSSNLDLQKGIELKDILISQSSDTIAEVQSFTLSPKSTLLSLVSGELNLNHVVLEGIRANISRLQSQDKFNWENAFAGRNSNDSDSKPPDLNLSFLKMADLSIKFLDEHSGLQINAELAQLEIDIDEIQIDSLNALSFNRILLGYPDVRIQKSTVEPIDDSVEQVTKEKQGSSPLPRIYVESLNVINGQLVYDNNKEIDTYRDLDVIATTLQFENANDWSGVIEDLTVQNEDIDISHFSTRRIERDGQNLVLDRAQINLDNSVLKLDIDVSRLSESFDIDRASAKVNIRPSHILLEDLFRFIPALEREFAEQPIRSVPIQIEGEYELSRDQLKGQDITLWLGENHYFNGRADFALLEDIRSSQLVAEVYALKSNMPHLDQLLTKVAIPNEIKRMGDIHFDGSFNGYLNDFAAKGRLDSKLGTADVNLGFDLTPNQEELIAYSGNLKLDSFDLGGLIDNQDFGLAQAQLNISNGTGKDLSTSSADIYAVINELEFKDIVYRDAVYEGKLSSRIVDGRFNISDDHLNFEFEGLVDFSQSQPLFDFSIAADRLNFCELNITDFPCEISLVGDFNFSGDNPSNAQGKGSIHDIHLRHDSTDLYIEKIDVTSDLLPNGMKFALASDFVDLDVIGAFNLIRMFPASFSQFLKNVSQHNASWKIKVPEVKGDEQYFDYRLTLKDATPLLDFLDQDMEQEGHAVITGSLDNQRNEMVIKGNFSKTRYKDFLADSLTLNFESIDDRADVVINAYGLERGNLKVENANFSTNFYQEFADWSIYYHNDENNQVVLSARSKAEKEGYFTTIETNDLVIDSTNWKFLPNPGVGVYPKLLDIRDLTLTDGARFVALNDLAGRGIEVSMNDFDLAFINPIINYDKLYFTGQVDSRFKVEDIFDDRVIQGFFEVDDFDINGDDFGELVLKVKQNESNVVDIDLSISKDTQNLFVTGYYDLDEEFINTDLTIEDYPMAFFEYIIPDGISDTEGTTDIGAKIYGPLDDMRLSALALVKNAGVKVDYLGAYYRMEDQTIRLDERFIDLSNVKLIDELGNEAVISGGMRHNFLGDIRADLSISSPRFIGLNTTDLDNPLYYGLGVGALDVSFFGPFDAIDINVTATTGTLSQLFIPITSTQYGYDESFIKFDYLKEDFDSISLETIVERFKESGVDFEMTLTLTPEAEISVIYDLATSNLLVGNGSGTMQINVTRDGDFTIYGNYDVESGNYRYTAYGLIAKPFRIRQGGSIVWTGDPINANINIEADYQGLRAPLNIFLAEYIDGSSLQPSEFSQRREVDLTLLLTGTLFNPAINFDIGFPNLVGELRTLANSKVRTLHATENGINNQVVGLLVFKNFLPDNNPLSSFSGGTLSQTSANTITEFLTTQLSVLFSDYLSSKLGNNDFISDIDFEIALAQNTSFLNNDQIPDGLIDVVPDEVQLNWRNRFKNERFVLNLGGNYVIENQIGTAKNYITGDFALDWYITENRTLKLRFYGKYDYDETYLDYRQKYGFGLNYRREFGSIKGKSFQNVLDDLIEEINAETKATSSKN